MDDEQLKTFIERVSELERTDEPDFREIARELGISDAQLENAREEGEDALKRGREFREREHWDDAIEELGDASVLLPKRLEPRFELASAFAGRYRATGDPEDAERAETLARQCLEVDPDHEAAYEVLDELESGRSGEDSSSSEVGLGVVAAAGCLLGLVALGGSGAAYFLLSSGAPEPDRPTSTAETASEPTASESTASEEGPRELPVDTEVAVDEQLELETHSSILEVYPEKNFYKLSGYVSNRSDTELKRLEAAIELVDDDGSTVVKESGKRLLASHEPRLRPDGNHPFFLLVESPTPAARARMTFSFAEGAPSSGDYPEPEPIEVEWESGRRELQFAERAVNWSKTEIMDRGGHLRAVFEVTNRSGRPVELLVTNLLSVDSGGERQQVSETYAVTSKQPPLATGETRTFTGIGSTPADHEDYVLKIQQVR